MRALSRSSGDISILTRSPTVNRTQRLRSLPLMVADTRCWLCRLSNGRDDRHRIRRGAARRLPRRSALRASGRG
jgi:hypothetical protein